MNEERPTEESLRMAMDQAWRDHHHARDQTWKTVQIVAVLGAGLLSMDLVNKNLAATAFATVLVVIASAFGAGVTWNHRKLEVRKFIHLMNCEELLGLHRDDVIPLYTTPQEMKSKKKRVRDGAVALPAEFSGLAVINPAKNNTALFILRMHLAIMVFAVLVCVTRWLA